MCPKEESITDDEQVSKRRDKESEIKAKPSKQPATNCCDKLPHQASNALTSSGSFSAKPVVFNNTNLPFAHFLSKTTQ
jgi:hypothetical protein